MYNTVPISAFKPRVHHACTQLRHTSLILKHILVILVIALRIAQHYLHTAPATAALRAPGLRGWLALVATQLGAWRWFAAGFGGGGCWLRGVAEHVVERVPFASNFAIHCNAGQEGWICLTSHA